MKASRKVSPEPPRKLLRYVNDLPLPIPLPYITEYPIHLSTNSGLENSEYLTKV